MTDFPSGSSGELASARSEPAHAGPIGSDDRAPADSAQVPWAGRDLTPSGFEGDTGTADPALARALQGGAPDIEMMRAVAAARLIVPVVAAPSETPAVPDASVKPGVDMAAVTLRAPDGTRALPVFSSVEALAGWDSSARPVPVTAAKAGQAAVSEGCEVLVVDVAGPHTRVLRSSMLWALAQQREWIPPHDDPFVERSVGAAVASETEVTAYRLHGDDGGGLVIELTLIPGLSSQQVHALATRVGERLATDGELRARIDGLTFRIT